MAKWGEGDPRWLVGDREDGKNVNAWHWCESSKLSWCQKRLGELLPTLTAEIPSQGKVSISGIKAVTGEASVSTRKGNKKLALYDLHITCLWEGQMEGNEQLVKGELKVEEFSSGSEEEDYVFTTTVEGTGAAQDECKKLAEANLKQAMLSKLRQLVEEMNEM